MNYNDNTPMDEQSLDDAEHFAGRAVNAVDELTVHRGLTEEEQERAKGAMEIVEEIYGNVSSRQAVAGTDWELVEENLDEIAELVEAIRNELPEERNVNQNDAALLVVNVMESVERDLFEARNGTKDILNNE